MKSKIWDEESKKRGWGGEVQREGTIRIPRINEEQEEF